MTTKSHQLYYPDSEKNYAQHNTDLECYQKGTALNNCDWIYGNRSKLYIGSYEIIDFNEFKAL